jgi:hypothetical protein
VRIPHSEELTIIKEADSSQHSAINIQQCGRRRLFGFFEVGVLEDVRRSTDKLEADPVAADVALGESVPGNHYRFVHSAVVALVKDLVDSGFPYGSARAEYATIGTALMLPARAAALELRPKTG